VMGERGQVVIPAELRKKYKLKKGERFIVFSDNDNLIILFRGSRLSKVIAHLIKKLNKLKEISK